MRFNFYSSVKAYHDKHTLPSPVSINTVEDLRLLLPDPRQCGSLVVDFDPLHYGRSEPTIVVHDDYLVGGPLSCQV